MKIIELEICNVRGIRHTTLKPDGKSFLIFGPNGTGKSAVTDAIDFLLTGDMNRLKGTGTRDVNIQRHGHHVDCDAADAYVRALVAVPGTPNPIEICRSMDNRKKLTFDTRWAPQIETLLNVATRNFFMLTRRDILAFIILESAKRAEQIKGILDLTNIEDIRKSLVTTESELRNQGARSGQGVQQALSDAQVIVGVTEPSRDDLLHEVNQRCLSLEIQPLESLEDHEVLASIPHNSRPADVSIPTANQLRRHLANVLEAIAEPHLDEVYHAEKALRLLVTDLKNDPQLVADARSLELLTIAAQVVDYSTTSCPICETSFEHGVLSVLLVNRLSKVSKGQAIGAEVSTHADKISKYVTTLRSHVSVLHKASETGELPLVQVELKKWLDISNRLTDALAHPVDSYTSDGIEPPGLSQLTLTQLRQTLRANAELLLDHFPATSPEDEARDILIKMQVRLSDLARADRQYRRDSKAAGYAEHVLKSFVRSQDDVLNALYEKIRDRFAKFYNFVHSDDEHLSAALTHSGPSLDFRVSFLDRGQFPPHALHSEGHQDTMGLCLFLALSEVLHPEGIDLIILDDVISSVDAGHRAQVSKLLREEFSHRQLLVTTHDRNWMKELNSRGVVHKTHTREFFGWTIDSGPKDMQHQDIWDQVEAELARNNVRGASASLRHGLEAISAHLCDTLAARVRFRLQPSWEFGELFYPAKSRYRELLGLAYKHAEKHGHPDKSSSLRRIKEQLQSVNKRLGEDQWMVNSSVHHNDWENLSVQEFRDIVMAYRDFFDLVWCQDCHEFLHIDGTPNEPSSLRCTCGEHHWLM